MGGHDDGRVPRAHAAGRTLLPDGPARSHLRRRPARTGGGVTAMDAQASGQISGHVTALVCTGCGATTSDPWDWACTACGPDARRDVLYSEDSVPLVRRRLEGRPFDMWRYAELLPVPPPSRAYSPLAIGGTPLVDAPRLAGHLGIARVIIKDD